MVVAVGNEPAGSASDRVEVAVGDTRREQREFGIAPAGERKIHGGAPRDDLAERLDEEVFEKKKRELLNELSIVRLERYVKFGDAACLQEPNVKETAGGLRDLHELFWASRSAHGTASVSG